MPRARPPSPSNRLEVSVFLGFVVGFAYTLLDGYLDHTLGAPQSAPARPVEVLHALIDFVLPAITGALFGVAIHYVRLRAKMAELERQRADSLSGDLHKIERDQAVWVVSASLLHELKNPLHALGLLLDEALDLGVDEGTHLRLLLVRARAQVERIAAELATLRALPSSTRPAVPAIEVGETMRLVAGAIGPKAPSVRVDVVADKKSSLWVKANEGYVRIVLDNLLENAVEALAGAGPDARIELRAHQLDSAHCAIDVCDNGPGLDEDARVHLFEPLNTTKSAGMGLGLAIARTLARAMGGDLTTVERPRGACFRLVLQLGEPA